MMFGPTDTDSPQSAQSMKWKIKRQSNDVLRQKFVDATVPQAKFLNLRIPDDDLNWNEESRHYDFGAIDWDEFIAVINGNGHCNRERITHHKKAHDDGAWVRECMTAFSLKQEAVKQAG
jgi:ring-1,2-phenylacetyl-CoA epoxidase subunit PaaA